MLKPIVSSPTFAEFIPKTSPVLLSSKGPPLFPGDIGAEI